MTAVTSCRSERPLGLAQAIKTKQIMSGCHFKSLSFESLLCRYFWLPNQNIMISHSLLFHFNFVDFAFLVSIVVLYSVL